MPPPISHDTEASFEQLLAMQNQILRTRGPWQTEIIDEPRPTKNPNNKHKVGDKLLVRAFDYGAGFEIVDSAEDRGEDLSYYQVEIKKIVPVKIEQRFMHVSSSPQFAVTNGLVNDFSGFDTLSV